jgi:hypothetical protein
VSTHPTRGIARNRHESGIFKTHTPPGRIMGRMVDLDAATDFLTTHGRLLDRRRLELLLGRGAPGDVRAALAAYRNADGGFGWGLEPDLRVPGSQPAGALHAFEILAETGGGEEEARALCDWLERAALPDGGLPFALPDPFPAGFSPVWAGADHGTSSLHITAAVCAAAHRVPAAAGHAWLERATAFCVAAIRAAPPRSAYTLKFCLGLLDAIRAEDDLAELADHLPRSGIKPVAGGLEDEALRPLDFAPRPGRPLRDRIAPEAIEADLDRLASGQQDDGGWTIDFRPGSPAAALEWRGLFTVHAIATLAANHRLRD